MSYGIFIDTYGSKTKFWYNFRKSTFYKVDNTTKNKIFGNELSFEEQIPFIKCTIRNWAFSEIYMSVTDKMFNTVLYDKFTFNARDTRSDLMEGFLLLYKLGTRYEALHDEQAKQERIKNMKQVSAEIECQPETGIKYQEAKDNFNSKLN